MAITRAQQVRQMLEDGGMLVSPSKDGKRPGYRRSNYDTSGGGLRSSTKAPGSAGPGRVASDRQASENRVAAATNIKSMQQALGTKGSISKKQQEARDRLKDQREGAQETIRQQREDAVIGRGPYELENKDLSFVERMNRFGAQKFTNLRKNTLRNLIDYIASGRQFRYPAGSIYTDLTGKGLNLKPEEYLGLATYSPGRLSAMFGQDIIGTMDEEKIRNISKVLGQDVITQSEFEQFYPNMNVPDDREGPDQQETDPCKGPNPPAYCFVNQNPTDPADPNQTTDVFAGIAPRFAGSIFDFDKLRRQLAEESAADGGRIGADKGGIMMASAPDPMDTRNDMMQNLAIDTFGKPLKDLTEDEIIQIEEMMMEMDQYGSKPTSRSNKMMADLDIETMFDNAKEQLSKSRFGKSYDELEPLEKELILEIIRGIGKDVFGEKQMPESDRVMAQEGGIMDLETGRQMYFLGKLVKKATRAVKKIAKSPLGKAAIGAALFKMGGGFKGLGALKGTLFGQAGSRVGQSFIPYKEGLFTKLGLTQGGGSLMPTFLGGGILSLGGLTLFGNKQKQEDLNMGPELTMEELLAIRGNPYGTTAPRFEGSKFAFAADGGRIGYQEGSKEPVAKKTMPLLDMGGKEMDLRDNGGFVPIGRMEKADDVPARLSKNEFVFTADAVRNAGEGDVDKGAEVMYNMMKNLESGGQVSEESQGLEGARKMFQTSKRLEEVL